VENKFKEVKIPPLGPKLYLIKREKGKYKQTNKQKIMNNVEGWKKKEKGQLASLFMS